MPGTVIAAPWCPAPHRKRADQLPASREGRPPLIVEATRRLDVVARTVTTDELDGLEVVGDMKCRKAYVDVCGLVYSR